MEFSEIKKLIEKHYPEILNEPGEVFFGSRNSLSNSNGVAIVGLNPGGSGLPTIAENISRYDINQSKLDFSGYLDLCWHEPYFSNYETCEKCIVSLEKTGIVHQDKHQKMVSRIASHAGFDLRRSIAMNAIWIQTRSAADLRKYLESTGNKKMIDLFKIKFFPIFQDVFLNCKVKMVLCLGNGVDESSFNFFRNAIGVSRENVVNITDNYRDGRYFEGVMNGRKIVFFGIAHPSMHITSNLGLDVIKAKWADVESSFVSV